VKNFNPTWTQEMLEETFSKYGTIKSLIVKSKTDKEGNEKPFAFVCYDNADDKTYGPQCAENAVRELHDQELGGFKLYVQCAVPKDTREAQVQREQQRFKNSKKKCNLFVKGFPANFGE
jgi:RNA recognition motif-containing protein